MAVGLLLLLLLLLLLPLLMLYLRLLLLNLLLRRRRLVVLVLPRVLWLPRRLPRYAFSRGIRGIKSPLAIRRARGAVLVEKEVQGILNLFCDELRTRTATIKRVHSGSSAYPPLTSMAVLL